MTVLEIVFTLPLKVAVFLFIPHFYRRHCSSTWCRSSSGRPCAAAAALECVRAHTHLHLAAQTSVRSQERSQKQAMSIYIYMDLYKNSSLSDKVRTVHLSAKNQQNKNICIATDEQNAHIVFTL